jgi:glyoxylase-like metal-dependent hydrolase (beta-lactamase superfamily II)
MMRERGRRVALLLVFVGVCAIVGPLAQTVPASRIVVVPVQGTVYMVAGAGANITVQVGNRGVLLVDTPPPEQIPQVLAEIRKLSDKPIQAIINTSVDADHVSGNLALAGKTPARGPGGAPFPFGAPSRPAIYAHENVFNAMSKSVEGRPGIPEAAWPTVTYFQPSMDFHSNGEPIMIAHQPAAHTDGDSIVFFRRSDVVSTGDVFTPDRYPVIDLDRGGRVEGIIAALNRVLAITVPENFQERGTYVIPGHGRLSDEADVVEYRDMVVIIRDRVQDLIKKKMTLEQVIAAKPSRDYDTEYDAAGADRFVETIYRSLTAKKPDARK